MDLNEVLKLFGQLATGKGVTPTTMLTIVGRMFGSKQKPKPGESEEPGLSDEVPDLPNKPKKSKRKEKASTDPEAQKLQTAKQVAKETGLPVEQVVAMMESGQLKEKWKNEKEQAGPSTVEDNLRAVSAGQDRVSRGEDPAKSEPAESDPPAAGPEPSGLSTAVDSAQLALDGIGIADPTPIVDGINAGISVTRMFTDPERRREHAANAAISAVSMVPFVGDLSKLLKVKRGAKVVQRGAKQSRAYRASRIAARTARYHKREQRLRDDHGDVEQRRQAGTDREDDSQLEPEQPRDAGTGPEDDRRRDDVDRADPVRDTSQRGNDGRSEPGRDRDTERDHREDPSLMDWITSPVKSAKAKFGGGDTQDRGRSEKDSEKDREREDPSLSDWLSNPIKSAKKKLGGVFGGGDDKDGGRSEKDAEGKFDKWSKKLEDGAGVVGKFVDKLPGVIKGLVKVAGAAFIAVKGLERLNTGVIELNRDLAAYHGGIAAAYAQYDSDKIQRDIRKGEALAGPLSNLTEEQSDLKDTLDEAMLPLQSIGLSALTVLTQMANVGVQVAGAIIPATDLIKIIADALDRDGPVQEMPAWTGFLEQVANGKFDGKRPEFNKDKP